MSGSPKVPRFKAVVVDHDDTAVDSSRFIHHPAHVKAMKELRPDHEPCDLAGWFAINSSPGGLSHYLNSVLSFTEEERKLEHKIWTDFSAGAPLPPFYDGFIELMSDLQKAGAAVVVCSHSQAPQVARHYATTPVTPDAIYGWTSDKTKNKPAVWPIEDTVRRFGLASASEVCVVDDMSPGIVMALNAGAYPVCAAWGPAFDCCHEVKQYMVQNVKTFCVTVKDLSDFLFVDPTSPVS